MSTKTDQFQHELAPGTASVPGVDLCQGPELVARCCEEVARPHRLTAGVGEAAHCGPQDVSDGKEYPWQRRNHRCADW